MSHNYRHAFRNDNQKIALLFFVQNANYVAVFSSSALTSNISLHFDLGEVRFE